MRHDPMMNEPNRTWIRLQHWGGPALIAVAYLLMLRWTRLRWPDVLIDFGRELYAPWQLTEGKVLFRDIAWFNGPLSAYLNALWFQLFGASLRTIVLCNAAILAGFLVLLYRLLAEIGNRFSATMGCLIAVGLFFFGNLMDTGNYTYICPYSHEATHGLILSLAALLFLQRGLDPPRKGQAPLFMMLSGLTLGLVLLTKIELILALVLAFSCRLLVHSWSGRPARPRALPLLGILLGAAAVPPLLATGFLWSEMPLREALLGSFGAFRYAFDPRLAALPFYRWVLGVLDVGANVGSILLWTASYAVVFGVAAALVWFLGRARRAQYIATGAYTLALAALFLWGWHTIKWPNAFRPLPLILAVIISLTLYRLLRKLPNKERGSAAAYGPEKTEGKSTDALRFALGVFALALLFKMMLNARIQGYGFVLALPGVLLLVTVLLAWVPSGLTQRGGRGHLFALPAFVVLVCVSLVGLSTIGHGLRGKNCPVGGGADRFMADSRGFLMEKALQKLSEQLAPERTLAVLPEGVMLNFLSGRENPTPYINFMPPELVMFGEERILASFQEHPPDFVAVVDRPTPEYGLPLFGTDYGRLLWAWVQRNYRPVWLLGKQPLADRGFGILLLRFAPAEAPANVP